MKKILVTGGAGFLWPHLCRRLLDEWHEVTCLDNLSAGVKENISDLLVRSGFSFVEHDVNEPFQSDELDEIYHLACPASPAVYGMDPIATMMTNVLGSKNVLDLAVKTKARILLASTSEVYGDPEVQPQSESYFGNVNPVGKRSCYAEGKRSAETIFADYHRMHGVDSRIVRIFNTYGPWIGRNDGRMISNFIVQALENRDITIYGTGEQTRTLLYVDDLIDGLVAMMENEKWFMGPVNMGAVQPFSVKELANLILEVIPESTSKIQYLPAAADDPKDRLADISRAKEVLGWQPKIGLLEGLKRTIAHFRSMT